MSEFPTTESREYRSVLPRRARGGTHGAQRRCPVGTASEVLYVVRRRDGLDDSGYASAVAGSPRTGKLLNHRIRDNPPGIRSPTLPNHRIRAIHQAFDPPRARSRSDAAGHHAEIVVGPRFERVGV